MRIRALSLALAATLALTIAPAKAETFEVLMLNRDKETKEAMVFKPAVLKIAPGDTVRFVSTDRGHNVVSLDGLIPEGAESFKSRMNKDIELTFDVPGVYAYKCQPHYAMGMIGIIIVGDDISGLDALAEESMPGRAKQRRDAYIEAARSLAGAS
ncbi:MAG: pseudoazurin [Pseudomonadota bacterium]